MPVRMREGQELATIKGQGTRMIRLRDPLTGDLLHLSGQGTTRDVNHSWLGLRHQADTLRQRAAAQGRAWPFVPVHRDLLEQEGADD